MLAKILRSSKNIAALLYFILQVYGKRSDSVIVILCKNEEREEIKNTLINFEEMFNKNHKYPYVFLNDKDWEEEFKTAILSVVSGNVTFGKILPKVWDSPENIDLEFAKIQWKKMASEGVPYAEKYSYHNMCRFFSVNFFNHPLLLKYKYYWRIEPSVRFRCPIKNDPFEKMYKDQLSYGFTIVIREIMPSIPTLGQATVEFVEKNKKLIPSKIRTSSFMFENGKYNGCHFWSNFEIGDFDFFRGKLYTAYAKFLDEKKGFYYERWGDAPVHSLAVGLFLDASKIHFFEEIGYTHSQYTHCPKNNEGCNCKQEENIDFLNGSCLPEYLKTRKELNLNP